MSGETIFIEYADTPSTWECRQQVMDALQAGNKVVISFMLTRVLSYSHAVELLSGIPKQYASKVTYSYLKADIIRSLELAIKEVYRE